jgi:hypothetical protein
VVQLNLLQNEAQAVFRDLLLPLVEVLSRLLLAEVAVSLCQEAQEAQDNLKNNYYES